MAAKIGIQLYSVRDQLAQGFEAPVRKIADLGYAGVEPAGFPGTTPEAAGKLFRQLKLEVPSAHSGLPIGDHKNEVLDAMRAIGCRRIISGFGPDAFQTLDKIKASCDTFNQAAAAAQAAGMQFGIHNHWWEFQAVEGQPVYKTMLKHLSADVFFEVDTYWARTAGADPAAAVRELGARAPILHIKDGPGVQGQHHTAVGDGIMDFPAIAKASAKTAEWWVVELDSCATDMMEAAAKSYAYLTREKLAKGTR